ncbi:hypothetical protein, partial [Enterobacter hormaechei]|uniref:hypothetical protein n=1 Tax=Enterobacter hormaechei TaxID=158836 RepID=UPI0019535C0C
AETATIRFNFWCDHIRTGTVKTLCTVILTAPILAVSNTHQPPLVCGHVNANNEATAARRS